MAYRINFRTFLIRLKYNYYGVCNKFLCTNQVSSSRPLPLSSCRPLVQRPVAHPHPVIRPLSSSRPLSSFHPVTPSHLIAHSHPVTHSHPVAHSSITHSSSHPLSSSAHSHPVAHSHPIAHSSVPPPPPSHPLHKYELVDGPISAHSNSLTGLFRAFVPSIFPSDQINTSSYEYVHVRKFSWLTMSTAIAAT